MLVTGRMKLKSKSITTIIILLLLVGIAYYFYNNSYENFQSEVSYTSDQPSRPRRIPTATIKGEKGEKGDKGDQGPPGPRGEKGDQGETVVLANDIFTGIYDELNRIKSKINLPNSEETPSEIPSSIQLQTLRNEYISIMNEKPYLRDKINQTNSQREYLQQYFTFLDDKKIITFYKKINDFVKRADESTDMIDFERTIRNFFISEGIAIIPSPNFIKDISGFPVDPNELKSLTNEIMSIVNEKPYLKQKMDQAFSQTQYLQQYFNSLESAKKALFYRNFINFIKTADESTDVMDFERTMRDFFISEGITIIPSPNFIKDTPQVNPNNITEEFNYLINDLQVITSEKPYLNELFDNNREKLDYLQKYSESLKGEQLNSYLRSAVAFTKAANTSTTVYDVEKFLRNFFISEGIEIPPSPNGEIESFTNRTTSYKDFTSKFNLTPFEYAPVL